MTRDEILKMLDEQHILVREALADIPEQAQIKLPYVDWWTLKDLLGHMAMWSQVAIQFIAEYRLDGVPKSLGLKDDDDLDRYNKRGVALRRDWTLPVARSEYETTHRDLIAAVQSLSDSDLTKLLPPPWGDGATLERLIAVNSYQHIPEHLEQIEAFRAQLAGKT